ncbi:hypothetical protein DLAC_06126 [Tieghemostelium lacteum]|uniref:ILEI/PANDER domain-containing protein n=1 Tax=Tieghemostelium lacteum TaxID=361077 RepID=A0A151ZHP6_TIELA|nr:hypothetical protein DLAC_06126 [Tieghemostelium lacteum]|eukprot:KYQ93435.1 hypothetical protein DLAC_06126 [Tieghemostelium lacteum]
MATSKDQITVTLKATQTLANCLIQVSGHDSAIPLGNGVNVLLYVPDYWANNNFIFHNFDLVSSVSNANLLEQYIDELPPQVLVIIVSAGNIPTANFTTGLRNALQSVGSLSISQDFVGSNNFCLIGSKGTNIGNAFESLTVSTTNATLEQTLTPKFHTNVLSVSVSPTSQFINRNGVQIYVPIGQGLNVVLFDKNMHFLSSEAFNTGSSDNECSFLVRHLNGIQPEVLVVMFTNGDVQQHLSTDAINMIKTFGSNFIDRLTRNDLWYLIGKKGLSNPLSEYSTNSTGTISGRYFVTGDEGSSSFRLTIGSGRKDTDVFNYSVVDDDLNTPRSVQTGSGLLITVIDDFTGITLSSQLYPTSSDDNINTICNLLYYQVAIGSIVMISASNCDTSHFNSHPLIPAIESLGSNLIRNFTGGSNQVYAIIGRKGASKGSVPEILSTDSATSMSADFDYNYRYTRPYIEIHARSVGQNAGTSSGTTEIKLNQVQVPMNYTIGLNVLVIDEQTGNILNNQTYDTHSSSTASSDFTTLINSLPNGRSVVIVINQDAITNLSTDAKSAIKLLGSQQIDSVQIGDSWSLVGSKGGDASSCTECHSSSKATSCESWLMVKSLYPDISGVNVSVHSCGKLSSSGSGMASIYFAGQLVSMSYGPGLNVVVFNPSDGDTIISKTNYNTVSSSTNGDTFADMIKTLPFGYSVIIAVQDSIGTLSTKAKNAFKMIGVESIDLVNQYGSLCVIGNKGFSRGSILENFSNDSPASIQLWIPLIPPTPGPEFIFGAIALIICLFAFSITALGYYVELQNHDQYNVHAGYTTNFTSPAYSGPPVRRPTKKALLVAINYKNTVRTVALLTDKKGDLQDSIVTMKTTRKRLVSNGYMDNSNIVMLSDDNPNDPNLDIRPTKANILKQIQWLTKDVQAGDVILFSYFGHGNREPLPTGMPYKNSYQVGPYQKSYLITLNSQNYPNNKEPLYATDFQSAFKDVPVGVNVTWLMNFCFAGGCGKNIPTGNTLNNNLIAFNAVNEDYPSNFRYNMLRTLNDQLSKDATYQTLYNKTYNQLKSDRVLSESNYPQPYQQLNQLNKTGKDLSQLNFLSPIN